MNQLRHLAIRTEEPEKLAAFYIEAFGFREVREGWPPVEGQGRKGKKGGQRGEERGIA